MLFVGHTRFSVYNPQSRSWKASNRSKFKTEQEYRDYLFSDGRLRDRTNIFLTVSIPQIALAAESHRIKHLLSYSELLPRRYQIQLEEAADNYDFIVLDKQESGKARVTPEDVARKELLDGESPHGSQLFGVYRLDDDDVLPANYFDINRPYLQEPFVGMQVSLSAGVTAIYIDGHFVSAKECYQPMLGIGFMSIQKFDEHGALVAPKTVPHNRSDRHYPVINDSRHIGYLWTRHLEQDTSLGIIALSKRDLLDSIRENISQYPAVTNLAELHKAFPLLEGYITSAKEATAKRTELASSVVTLDRRGRTFAAPPTTGRISISARFTCDMNAISKNAILSFSFVDDTGSPISSIGREDLLEDQPISLSGNASIGWFRYLKTKPGKGRMVIQFELPAGVFMRSITIGLWRKYDTTIKMHSLAIEGDA